MNRDRVIGVWRQFNGTLKHRWGKLTGNPLAAADGERELRDGRIRERRGISREHSERQLEQFMIRNRNWRDLSNE